MKSSSLKYNARLNLILIAIVVISLSMLLPLSGCTRSRDSGSTVTGRAMEYPFGNMPFLRVLVQGETGSRFQITGSDGGYSMFHVPVGLYTITFAYMGVEIYSQDLVIDENEMSYLVDMPEYQQGPIPLTINVTDESDDSGIPGASIWFFYENGSVAHGVSDEDGTIAMINLSEGIASVVTVKRGYEVSRIDGFEIGFETDPELNVVMSPLPESAISAIVGTVVDENDLPLDDAYVGVYPEMTEPSIFAVADAEVLTADGEYTIDNLPAGAYEVLCTKSGYLPKTMTIFVSDTGPLLLDFKLTSEEDAWQMSKLPQSVE